MTINSVLETGSNTRTSLHIPAITTQNVPINIFVVFCTSDPEKMSPDEIFQNQSFPRAQFTTPSVFTNAQDIVADVATSSFTRGVTYKAVILVQYAWPANVKNTRDFSI